GLAADAAAIARELVEVKEQYAGAWLRHNKREGLETSLAVFDEIAGDFALRAASSGPEPGFPPGFVPLSGLYNDEYSGVDGIPIGLRVLDGVPFDFAPIEWTHARLDADRGPIALPTEETVRVRDLHVVVSVGKPVDERPCPALTVELRRAGASVFTET